MRVAMIGSGYVGLVSGAGFAETGAHVVCADINAERVAALNRGEIPIYEPGLETIVRNNAASGRIRFTTEVSAAIRESEVIFAAVGTPSRTDGAADLRAIDDVAEAVAQCAGEECVLVLKSTVPVGTNARVRRIVKDAAHKVHVVSNPEFLKEGDAVQDFFRPERIVVGCQADDAFAKDVMTRIYHPLCINRDLMVWMAPESAELTKYVANTMLAMRISFMNEISMLCEKVGADVNQVRLGVGTDSRIGPKFLYAGPGYGGSCFPKDVQALVQTARDHGMELELASATDRVNDRQKGVLLRKLRKHFDGDLRGKTIALWGIAFKPRTDDTRQSPALTLIETLLAEGARVQAHDPQVKKSFAKQFDGSGFMLADEAYQAIEGADALVLVTEWREYLNPDFKRVRGLLKRPLIIDGRNIWSSYGLRKLGLTYDGIGVTGS